MADNRKEQERAELHRVIWDIACKIVHAGTVRELQDKFPVGVPIEGEQAQKEFIKLYSAILRLRNIIMSFDKFEGQDILTDRDRQDYQSIYILTYIKS